MPTILTPLDGSTFAEAALEPAAALARLANSDLLLVRTIEDGDTPHTAEESYLNEVMTRLTSRGCSSRLPDRGGRRVIGHCTGSTGNKHRNDCDGHAWPYGSGPTRARKRGHPRPTACERSAGACAPDGFADDNCRRQSRSCGTLGFFR
jgi:hypothetical protein